jgi:hypothetical protein
MSPPTAERRPDEGSGSSASSLARQHQSTTDRARAHVAATRARLGPVAVDDDVWIAAVVAHLEPLDVARPWRLLTARHRPNSLRVLAPVAVRRLGPPAGTRPQPVCPDWCHEQHPTAA